MPTTNNISSWFKSSEIDYFSVFMKLWLSFNAWYRQHYNEEYIRRDRNHINIIRGVYKNQNEGLNDYDRSTRNSIRRKFMNLMEQRDIESKEFRKYVEKFLYLFKEKTIEGLFDGQSREGKNLSKFFIDPSNTLRAIKIGLTKGRYFSLGEDPAGYSKGTLVIGNDLEKLYSYIMEIIYQIRNSLIHGNLAYTDNNHETVKYCYLILYYLIKDLVRA